MSTLGTISILKYNGIVPVSNLIGTLSLFLVQGVIQYIFAVICLSLAIFLFFVFYKKNSKNKLQVNI